MNFQRGIRTQKLYAMKCKKTHWNHIKRKWPLLIDSNCIKIKKMFDYCLSRKLLDELDHDFLDIQYDFCLTPPWLRLFCFIKASSINNTPCQIFIQGHLKTLKKFLDCTLNIFLMLCFSYLLRYNTAWKIKGKFLYLPWYLGKYIMIMTLNFMYYY